MSTPTQIEKQFKGFITKGTREIEKSFVERTKEGNSFKYFNGEMVIDQKGETKYIEFTAKDQLAERMKSAVENGTIKFTISGKPVDSSYTNSKGEIVSKEKIFVNNFIEHQLVEAKGKIISSEEKLTSNNKPYKHLYVESTEGNFNLNIYAENLKTIPSDVSLNRDSEIAFKGEGSILTYKNGEKSMVVNTYNVDLNLERLHSQIEELKQSAKEKLQTQEPLEKEAKPKKEVKAKAPEKNESKTKDTKPKKNPGLSR